MNKILYAIFSIIVAFIPSLAEAKCYTDAKLESKLNDLAFVVYCEDKTDETAMMLVMSTIYNRAQSHDVGLLHAEVAKKNQYYCFTMKKGVKKVDNVKYSEAYDLVCDFVMNERSPVTRARYFYNHKLVRPTFARTKTVVQVYGSHTYLM